MANRIKEVRKANNEMNENKNEAFQLYFWHDSQFGVSNDILFIRILVSKII